MSNGAPVPPLIAGTKGKNSWEIHKANFEPTSRTKLAGLIDQCYKLEFHDGEENIGIFSKRAEEKEN